MKSFKGFIEDNRENRANPYAQRATRDVLERMAREHIFKAENSKKHGVNSMDEAGDFISGVVDHFYKNHDPNDYTYRGHSESAANALEAHGIEVPENLMDQIKEAHEEEF